VLALALAACAVLGVVLQRHRQGDRLRTVAWWTSFAGLAPFLVVAAFLTIDLHRGLVLAIVAAIAASWIVLGLAYPLAHRLGRSRDERGCLALAASFGNTGYLGVPLTLLAFGPAAVPFAVLYDRLGWGFPPTAISTVIARTHGAAGDAGGGRWLRAVVLNPPAAALVLAVVLRAWLGESPGIEPYRDVAAYAVGPLGFLLLGLSVSLERVRLTRHETLAGTAAIAIKVIAGPLVLLAFDRMLGADVPDAFYLSAAVPGAFHLLVLARVYDLRPVLMRAMVVVSSLVAAVAVAIWSSVT
jgi:predicted permease